MSVHTLTFHETPYPLTPPGNPNTIQYLIPRRATNVELLKQVKNWHSPSRDSWWNCLINSQETTLIIIPAGKKTIQRKFAASQGIRIFHDFSASSGWFGLACLTWNPLRRHVLYNHCIVLIHSRFFDLQCEPCGLLLSYHQIFWQCFNSVRPIVKISAKHTTNKPVRTPKCRCLDQLKQPTPTHETPPTPGSSARGDQCKVPTKKTSLTHILREQSEAATSSAPTTFTASFASTTPHSSAHYTILKTTTYRTITTTRPRNYDPAGQDQDDSIQADPDNCAYIPDPADAAPDTLSKTQLP